MVVTVVVSGHETNPWQSHLSYRNSIVKVNGPLCRNLMVYLYILAEIQYIFHNIRMEFISMFSLMYNYL